MRGSATSFTVEEFSDLVKILEEYPRWRAELRRLLLTEELLELPAIVRELAEAQKVTERRVAELAEAQKATEERLEAVEQRMEELAEAQKATERRIEELAAAQKATEERLEAVERRIEELAEAQKVTERRIAELAEAQKTTERRVEELTVQVQNMAEQLSALISWQRGEAGRREGERYERQIVKRAPVLFRGGKGGATDATIVQERLSDWLAPLLGDETIFQAEEDPTLCDLIWWKDGKVAVVEVSLKVNGNDVMRAFRRAKTLQSAGVNAFGVVVGEDWASIEARERAKEKGVEWFVGGIPSDGLIAFRKLS